MVESEQEKFVIRQHLDAELVSFKIIVGCDNQPTVAAGLLEQKKLSLFACRYAGCFHMKTHSLRKRLLGIKLKVGKKLSLFIWISRDVITTCRESLRMTALAQVDTLQR